MVIAGKMNAAVACNCTNSEPWKGGVAPYKERKVLNAARTNTIKVRSPSPIRWGCSRRKRGVTESMSWPIAQPDSRIMGHAI